MSLADDHCGECNHDPCTCVGPLDEEPIPNKLKRSYASVGSQFIDDEADDEVEEVEDDEGDVEIVNHNRGYQRHFQKALRCDESYSPEPDLDAYFAGCGLSAQQRIAMCRTYANYLTQKLRSSGKLAPPRPKTQWKKGTK